MFYLPFAAITLTSFLTAKKITDCINLNFKPVKLCGTRIANGSRIFEGTLLNSNFRIKRVVAYNSRYNQLISGVVKLLPQNKSHISLNIRIMDMSRIS